MALCQSLRGNNKLCGIAGFTHKDWVPATDRIVKAVSTLVHRGPDQQGVFRSDICSLGATRLKILDLEGGNQPITSVDGDTTIVFNGEIYNHLELRKELEQAGHRFSSHCDTETVLHAFLQWDVGCFARLRGMFAVALWTRSHKRLVIARDRMGIKPLYIAQRGHDLYFGSELKTILIHPEIDRNLSLNGLDCYLSLNYVPSPWTLVDGVEKLPPAHWLEWKNGLVRTNNYWELPYGVSNDWTLESAEEELDSLLKQSVREHLLSDVPLGVWLSGGVDSSTILHYAAEASSSRLKTYSISFEGRSFDETEYIKRVVAQYGTEHEQLDLNPNVNLLEAIEQFAYFSDEPSADAGALPVWFLSKLCKTGTTVALSGEGADELFGGYLTYRANRLSRNLRRLPRGVIESGLKALKYWPVSDEKIGLDYKLKRFAEGSLLSPEQAHIYWNGTFSEAQKTVLLNKPLPGSLDTMLAELDELPESKDDLAPYLYFDQKYYLPDDILVKSDRMSMAHAVEVRPPFLDHRIVEFAASLPASLKIRGSRQKFVLKHLMKGKLPPAVITRKKVGFDIPAHEWMRGPLRQLAVETITQGASEHNALFRPHVVERFLRSHLERQANLGYHLWGLMVLFLWMKRWGIQAVPAWQEERRVAARSGVSI